MVKSEPHLKTEAKNSAMEEIPPKLGNVPCQPSKPVTTLLCDSSVTRGL